MTSKVLWAWVGSSLAAVLAACTGGYVEDPAAYCRQVPNATGCSGLVGGQGGTAGAPVQGQSGAPTMGGGGSGVGGGGSGGVGGEGGSPGCEASQIECLGGCVDPTTDAINCGECGYACGAGSACDGGVCTGVAVVSGVVAPYAFALDGDNVYFVTPVADGEGDPSPAVRKAPRNGGPVTSVFLGVSLRARTLTLSGSQLYFGDLDNSGLLVKGPADGSSGIGPHVSGPQTFVQHLLAADGKLWWSSSSGDASRVRRGPIQGTNVAAEELLPLPSQAHFGRVTSLAVEGAGPSAVVYWVNVGGGVDSDKGLWRKNEGSAAAPQRLVPNGDMFQLSLTTGGVLVADATLGIGRASKDAPQTELTPVVPAASLGGTLQGLTATAEALYWLVFNTGQLEVRRSALDGTGARVLGRVAAKSTAYWTQATIGPSLLVVDGGSVYFADPGTVTNVDPSDPNIDSARGQADGAVYRLPQ